MNPLTTLNALRDAALPPYAKLVGMVLTSHADASGRSWPSLRTLQSECGIARNTVLAALADLEARGIVSRAARARGATESAASNLYTVRPPETWRVVAARKPRGGLPRGPRGGLSGEPGGSFGEPGGGSSGELGVVHPVNPKVQTRTTQIEGTQRRTPVVPTSGDECGVSWSPSIGSSDPDVMTVWTVYADLLGREGLPRPKQPSRSDRRLIRERLQQYSPADLASAIVARMRHDEWIGGVETSRTHRELRWILGDDAIVASLDLAREWREWGPPASSTRLTSDDGDEPACPEEIRAVLGDALAKAQPARIADPYVLPPPELDEVLARGATR